MIHLRLITYNILLRNKKPIKTLLLKSTYSTSTQPVVQNIQEDYEKQLKGFETLTNITKKARTKKPHKPPFAKNLFLGIFDTDILTYPQLEKEDVENLEQNVTPLEKLVKQKHMIDCDTLSNKNFRQNLSDYKAIGLQASQFMDGRECNITESSRFLEILSEHKLRDNIIYNEQLGIQTLIKFANEHLKKKYLLPLIRGELLSAFCMSEKVLSNISSIKTKGTLSGDQKTWILDGEKTCVVNGISADVLIVFALTEIVSKDSIKEVKITAFVVEKDFPGISYKRIDNNDIEIADITFNNTPVPEENVIGEINKAEEILSPIITEFRLGAGPACIALTKKILNNLSKHILQQTNDTNLLNKTDLVGGKLGEISTLLYAMESVSYLTTGLMDSYENQDCELESAIVKVFCSKNCLGASLKSLDLVGALATSDSHWATKFHKESLRYLTLHETNDSLNMIIALLGLQHGGANLNEKINKLRNPLFHGGFIYKRMWTNRRNIEDNPKLNLQLGDYLHPSLYAASQHLEYCVKRLEFATETMLAKFGTEVVNKHMDLRRLAECAIDIYVMTACVGRASRSYCIGLQHGDYEMVIANTFCAAAMERVKFNVKKIFEGQVHTNDGNYKGIAKRLFKFKGYFPKHPIARNF